MHGLFREYAGKALRRRSHAQRRIEAYTLLKTLAAYHLTRAQKLGVTYP